MTEAASSPVTPKQPDLLAIGKGRLGLLERLLIRFVRHTFEPGLLDRSIRICQRGFGSAWIHHFTKHLRHVYGLERLPRLEAGESVILVSNHRSFFDLYVVTGELVRRGLQQRIVFPVRSSFFYTSFLGLFVNGIMSFFAMYPPIFRERRKLILNPASLDELVRLLRRGGIFAGMHPEGTRKRDDDPYSLLPAQSGVGRVIHAAGVPVIPVFVNGLINNLPRQVLSNFDGTGREIVVVFGAPIDFGNLLAQAPSPRAHQAIADHALLAIRALGEEEKFRRGQLSPIGSKSRAS